MKNAEHFGELTPRMGKFREDVLNKKPYICAERAMLVTETYQKHKNQPSVMKRALMLQNILEHMSIYIEDETLIVGNQAASNKDAPIFPEYRPCFSSVKQIAFSMIVVELMYKAEKARAVIGFLILLFCIYCITKNYVCKTKSF